MKFYNLIATFCLCILSRSVYAQTESPDLTLPSAFKEAWENKKEISLGGSDQDIRAQISLVRFSPSLGVTAAGVPKMPPYFALLFKTAPITGYFVEVVVLKKTEKEGDPDQVEGKYPILYEKISILEDEEVKSLFQVRLGRLPTPEELVLGKETFPRSVPYPISVADASWGVRVRVLVPIPGKTKKYRAVEIRQSFASAPGVSH